MLFTLDTDRLKRYKDLLILLIKYGSAQTLSDRDELVFSESNPDEDKLKEKADNLADDLEKLGPTFIKLGQLLSTRPDFISPVYIEALTRLQDKVEPFAFEEVEKIVQAELGVRISKAFTEFNYQPLAAASLGQVHFAVLRDGRPVAVKVQRPHIKEVISKDLEALEEIASSLDHHTETGKRLSFQNILKEFKKALILELDYKQEAQNLIKMGDNLKNFENIIVPQPVSDYTTESVLTMDFISGKKITSLTPLAKIELNAAVLAADLFKAYLDQVLVYGFFHADPHPGNIFLTDDKKIALIDLGMTANIDPEMRENLLKLLLYISEGRAKEAVEISLKIGDKAENFDEVNFNNEVTEFIISHQDIKLENINTGRIVFELSRIAGKNGVRLPSSLTMLGKTLLNLDEIGRTLDPDFNPNKEIRNYSESLMQKQMMKSLSPGSIFSSLLEMNEFAKKLPGRLNNFIEALTNNKLQFTVKAFDDIELMHNLQKIANRITMGLVLAALIVGAALMMQVNTRFTIFGYPGLPVIFFLIAAICGFVLIFNILWGDKQDNKKSKFRRL
jgi:predicted unusual protein kinase regulating ubiquinone biosynthesis (AarF/ABC1/UbiB family)